MTTFRVLSALLTYPTDSLVAALPDMKRLLEEEGLLPVEDQASLAPLFAELANRDIYDLQARYVELFDQYRALSLHLFEHVHGESRDRGQAMVSLLERYRETGLELSTNELPDFLPVFLEYLSQLPVDDARAELADPVAVIATLARRLANRASPYAAVLSALEHLAEAEPSPSDLEELAGEESADAENRKALDAEWQEEPVDFSRREASFVGRQRARSLGAALRKEQ
ncbi:MAG TPA: nitrate reductase molybdenum cofactor assembly chaperone [Spirochaetia bacterium]|nr:nitrate reductase molybdenum cofactor assembly chaperone [Spirochaetia bacterium]